MAGIRLTQLEPYGLPGRRAGSFVGKASGSPLVPMDRSDDDGSRDYEKWRYRSGRLSKYLPRDRFDNWTLPGGGTPPRH